MRARPRLAAIASPPGLSAISLAALACAGDPGRTAGGNVLRVDSSGIEIVTNRGSPAGLPTWSLELVLDIGGELDDPDEHLFRVADAALLSDGRIVVANSGTHELRYFGPDGTLALTVGGEGEGPGEFQRLSSIDAGAGDSIFASDPGQRRVSVFAPDGGFARDFTLTPPDDGELPQYLTRFADGWMLASLFEIISADQLENLQLFRRDISYLRYAPDGSPSDAVGTLPSTPSLLRMYRSGGRVSAVSIEQIPFATRGQVAFSAHGFAMGAGETYEVRLYEPGGSLRQVIRRPTERDPVTPELAEALLEERLGEIEDPAARREAREDFADLPLPDRLPAFDGLLLDRTGHVWVRDPPRPGDESARWTVFDTSGAMTARVELPTAFTAFEIGDDHLLGHWVDELDVEHVQLQRLVRRPRE